MKIGRYTTDHKIVINCTGTNYLNLDQLQAFQGKIKKLSNKNREKLAKSILKNGFIAPFFVWEKREEAFQTYHLLDGHQRLNTLNWMKNNGWEIPELPVVLIVAENEDDAKVKLLHITSQYGEFNLDELTDFIDSLNFDFEDSFRFVNKELNIDKLLNEEEKKSKYTDLIKAPIYEITGEKPKISTLYNNEKSEKYIKLIKEKNFNNQIEVFLIESAKRLIEFDYKKIAEFYSHSNKDVQDIMEKLALVIIDYDKAYENGYIEISNKLKEQRELENE